MSYLEDLQKQNQMPRNALLFFWDVADLLYDDNDMTHVIFSDSPDVGGWHDGVSRTHKQVGCSNEEVRPEDYRIVPGRRGDEIADRIESIQCAICREKVLYAAQYSGLLDEE